MFKRVYSYTGLFLFLGFTFWLIIKASENDKLPIGSKIPHILYADSRGNKLFLKNELSGVILVYFNSNCQHCIHELTEINENIHSFNNVSFYLLTSEIKFFVKGKVKGWGALYSSLNVTFGIVNKQSFKDKFGSVITPTIYIFNEEGILVKRYRGVVKIKELIEILKHDGPEHRVSG